MASPRRAFLAGLAATATVSSACGSDPSTSSTTSNTVSSTTTPTRSTPTGTLSKRPIPAGPASSAPASDLLHGPRDKRLVALTFHGAGDPSLARQVLAEAERARAHLTVLAVGTWLAQTPSLAKAITGGGHELGNHTWTHQPMRRLDAGQARDEIARAADLLDRLTGSRGTWFRPSGTPRSTGTIRAAALRSGYRRCLSYDVDPLDYTDPGPAAIVRTATAQVRPGSIVSLHLGHAGTVAALPKIFAALADKGLTAVTVSRLVEGKA